MVRKNPTNIRAVDDTPRTSRASSTRKVERSYQVRVVLEPTAGAPEQGLGFPIVPADVSAPRAGLGSVSRIDTDYWDPSLQYLVSNVRLELTERPRVEPCPLGLPEVCLISYPVQVFEDNHVSIIQRVHEPPADLVEHGVRPSPLPVAEPFQAPSCASRAFGLERGSQLPEVFPSFEYGFAPDFETVGGYEEVVHPYVNTDWVVSLGFWSLTIDGDVNVGSFALIGQDSVGGLGPAQKLSLVFAECEFWLDPLLNCGDGSMDAVWLMHQPEKPRVQIERRLVKSKELVPSLLVSFSHPVSGSNCEVGGKSELCSSLAIDEVVERDGVEDPALESHLRGVVARVLERLNSAEQLLLILIREPELADDGFGELHRKYAYAFFYLRVPQFIPPLKWGVSLRWFL